MSFTNSYYEIKEQWKGSPRNFRTSSGTEVTWVSFRSESRNPGQESTYLSALREAIPGAKPDESIIQNSNFEYPVFRPGGLTKNNGAILMLHGLNERRWDKYISWADYLVAKTGKNVILFPISFHLNRSLPEWTDRHTMMERVLARKSKIAVPNEETTFINEALSERLTELPERFFLSGLQTSNDLTLLLKDIYEGNHPLFGSKTICDIFAYSIGGLLAQVMYIANPDELLSESKLFLFCAGSLFHEMNGISKLIMDPVAYHRIYSYYTSDLENQINRPGVFSDFFNNNRIGMAFRSMIAPDRCRSLRERIFQNRKENIFAISMKKDRVIPSAGISRALMGTGKQPPSNMEVLDFPSASIHEMPFPVNKESLRKQVDDTFEKVFSKAAAFLV